MASAVRMFRPSFFERSRKGLKRLGPQLVGSGAAGLLLVAAVGLLLASTPSVASDPPELGPFAFEGATGWTAEGAFEPGLGYGLQFIAPAQQTHWAGKARSNEFVVPDRAALGFRMHLEQEAQPAMVLTLLAENETGTKVLFDSLGWGEQCPAARGDEGDLCAVAVDLRELAGERIRLVFQAEASGNGGTGTRRVLVDDLVVVPGAGETFAGQ